MFVLHASLLAAEEDVQLSVIDADPCPMRSLMGSLVSNAYNVYDDERYNVGWEVNGVHMRLTCSCYEPMLLGQELFCVF